jgi:TPR repeat protein
MAQSVGSYVMKWKNDDHIVNWIKILRKFDDSSFFGFEQESVSKGKKLVQDHLSQYLDKQYGTNRQWLLDTALTLKHELPSRIGALCIERITECLSKQTSPVDPARLCYLKGSTKQASELGDDLAKADWAIASVRESRKRQLEQSISDRVKICLAELSARSDDPIAMTKIATCYLNGWGTQIDVEGAARLYKQAADFGYTEAQFRLGLCFLTGQGEDRDVEKASALFQKAKEFLHTGAEAILGIQFYMKESGEYEFKANVDEADIKSLMIGGLQAIFESHFKMGDKYFREAQKIYVAKMSDTESLIANPFSEYGIPPGGIEYMLGYIHDECLNGSKGEAVKYYTISKDFGFHPAETRFHI